MRLPTIRKQRIFDELRAIRSGVDTKYLRIVWLPSYENDQKTEFAMKITKYAGNAVFRNRVRRIIREFLREDYTKQVKENEPTFNFPDGYKVLIIIKRQVKELSKDELSSVIIAELFAVLKKFNKKVS